MAAICKRYVDLALDDADFSEVKRLIADETLCAPRHEYVVLVADADARRVLSVPAARTELTSSSCTWPPSAPRGPGSTRVTVRPAPSSPLRSDP